MIQLTEKHIIKKTNPFYKEIDRLGFESKNLYNYANYIIRQSFINDGKYLNYNVIQKELQNTDVYRFLPAKVSQQILKVLDKNWVSFFKSIKEYSKNPSKYKARPKLPRYKDKTKGRNILIYTIQAISKKELKKGFIKLSGSDIKIKSNKHASTQLNNHTSTTLSSHSSSANTCTDPCRSIQQVRIIPKNKEYVIEVIYNQEEINSSDLNKNDFISIDIGLNNLATITSNKKGLNPVIINGRVLKSINQYFNKNKAKYQSYIGDKGTSNKIISLTNKRNKKVSDYLHKASRIIINLCLFNKIGKIIVGKNKQWKQEINIGSKNNQTFVSIPHAKFIDMITYKAKLLGIEVIVTEESYTSKCSFIDNEPISKHDFYVGKRVKRGLFKSSNNFKINADCNGSLNIARKVIPNFNINTIEKGIQGIVVSPIRLNPYKLKIS